MQLQQPIFQDTRLEHEQYNRTVQEWFLNQYHGTIFAGISCIRIYAHKYATIFITTSTRPVQSRESHILLFESIEAFCTHTFLKWSDQLKCRHSNLFATVTSNHQTNKACHCMLKDASLIRPDETLPPHQTTIASEAKTFLLQCYCPILTRV